MNNLALAHGLDRWTSVPAPVVTDEASRKIFARFMPGNPLISLDSDERMAII
jgi:hypothetical protein